MQLCSTKTQKDYFCSYCWRFSQKTLPVCPSENFCFKLGLCSLAVQNDSQYSRVMSLAVIDIFEMSKQGLWEAESIGRHGETFGRHEDGGCVTN